MICAQCKFAEVPDGAKFCPICGARIAPPAEAPKQPERTAGAQVTVTTHVGQGDATGLRINQVDQLVINNPSPQQLHAAVQMQHIPTELPATAPGAHMDDPTRERLAAMETHLKELSEQVSRSDTVSRQVDSVHVGGVEVSRVELLLKRAILLHTEGVEAMSRYAETFTSLTDEDSDALSNETEVKFNEARSLLNEARDLAPVNVEVLLHLAKLLDDMGEGALEIRPVLRVAQRLLDPPRNEEQRFQLAQSLYLSAVADPDDIDAHELEKAREIFDRLRREEWVALCDAKLAADRDDDDSGEDTNAPDAQPASWLSRILSPVLNQNWQQPQPQTPVMPPLQPIALNPVGRWNIGVSDGTSWVLDFIFGGALQGQVGMFMGFQPVGGQWGFNPYTNMLQFAGYMGGILPFNIVLTIQRQEGFVYHAYGSDGHNYVLQRLA